ncbi:MAG: hypothetical protein NT144_14080 [Bacteroidia bacterium]|nr:hypothetical protein [Bacteroidia bacterium]
MNKISKIYSVSGTANTMYSGSQAIETEYYNGSYRLRDATRNIETYNLHNGTDYGTATYFTDNDNNWIEQTPILKTVTINNISNIWWYNSIVDPEPDLFLKIFDGNSNLVLTTLHKVDEFPPNTFDVYLPLSTPPYTVEVYDYDPISDDYGGSFILGSLSGVNNFSTTGSSGSYNIEKKQSWFRCTLGYRKNL